jgi:hypothetical protein
VSNRTLTRESGDSTSKGSQAFRLVDGPMELRETTGIMDVEVLASHRETLGVGGTLLQARRNLGKQRDQEE